MFRMLMAASIVTVGIVLSHVSAENLEKSYVQSQKTKPKTPTKPISLSNTKELKKQSHNRAKAQYTKKVNLSGSKSLRAK